MPQNFKKTKSTSSSTSSNKTHNTSRKTSAKTNSHRIIKPRNASLAAQRNVIKKAAGGLTAQLERKLAEKAGHVELLLGKGVKTERRKGMLNRGKVEGGSASAGGTGKKGPTGKSIG